MIGYCAFVSISFDVLSIIINAICIRNDGNEMIDERFRNVIIGTDNRSRE